MDSMKVQTHIFLPTELWNSIFSGMRAKDLTTLARVSRLFQRQAEYVLYRHTQLSHADGACLASWCTSIIGEGRRASCVHTIQLPGFIEGDLSRIDIQRRPSNGPGIHLYLSSGYIQHLLAQAFKAVVNLKELYIVAPRMCDTRDPTVVPQTFENCTFRLTAIVDSFSALTADEMLEFLSTQPDISYWIPSDDFIQSIDAIPPNTLPSIREVILCCPEKLPLLYNRPIQKLCLTFRGGVAHTKDDGLAVIRSLRRFENTLRVLSYSVFGTLTGWTTLDVIRSLARDAPNIEILVLPSCGEDRVSFRDLTRRFFDNRAPGTRSAQTNKTTSSKPFLASSTCILFSSPFVWPRSASSMPILPIPRIHSNTTQSGHPIHRRKLGKWRLCLWHRVRPFGVYRFRSRVAGDW
jgi:hypothetical protein